MIKIENNVSQNQPVNLVLAAIILAFFSIGCDDKQKLSSNEILESLVDTVFLGEDRQVFISDGVGGYYFDDALRSSGRSEYGYSRSERKILSGWSVLDGSGRSLDSSLEYTIVHPTHVQFHYVGGMQVTVQMPVKFPGIIINVRLKNTSGIIFRPQFDMRKLDREETPEYISNWNDDLSELTVSRRDTLGGWTTVSTDEETIFRSEPSQLRKTHQQSYVIGTPDESISWSPGEFQLESGENLSMLFSWGKNSQTAKNNLAQLKSDLLDVARRRQQWALSVLEPLKVACNDRNFIKSFAWARLISAQLIVENDHRKYLMNGIPFEPYPHGFYTCFSLPGLLNTGILAEDALLVLNDLVSFQNKNELSDSFGMIPGIISEDGAQYKIPEIGGMVAVALKGLNLTQPLDSADHVRFGKILYNSLVGSAKYRLYNGLVHSKGDEYLLWDSPIAPDRQGATIESQVLFGKLQDYILRHPFSDAIDPEMPTSLLHGSGTFRQRLYKGDLVATGNAGGFIIPLTQKQLLGSFNKTIDRKFQRMDQIKFVGVQELDVEQEVKKSATSEISRIIAMYLNDRGEQLPDVFAMEHLIEKELMGASGFRSRSPQDEHYDPEHLYLLEDSPSGTKTSGDILVWTSGMMADILRKNAWGNTNNWLRINQLLSELSRRILSYGVLGGLPEAEDAEAVRTFPQPVGNSIYLASNAEYLRMVTENILGIVRTRGIYLNLRPHFPAEWGETELQFRLESGSVSVKRINQQLYGVTQTGVKPHLELSFEFILESNSRVFTSARIYPDEEVQIHLDRSKNGNLIGRVVRKGKWQ